jgi:hypothetical protein
MAIFTGGLVQLLAGMWEFPRGNVFGATGERPCALPEPVWMLFSELGTSEFGLDISNYAFYVFPHMSFYMTSQVHFSRNFPYASPVAVVLVSVDRP